MGSYVLKVREQNLISKALWHLNDSNGDLEGVQDFCRRIREIAGGDFMVLTVPDAENPTELRWLETLCRPPLVKLFPEEVAANDFVFAEAMNRQGMVVRDQEMMSRRLLRRTWLYSRGVDTGCRIERVQAWITVAKDGLVVGGAMHRSDDVEFQERERMILEQVIHPLHKVLARSIRLVMAQKRSYRAKELMGEASVLFDCKGKELARTSKVKSIIRNWFAADELDGTGLPEKIVNELHSRMALQAIECDDAKPWVRRKEIEMLRVLFKPLLKGDWEVVFEELGKRIELPLDFKETYGLTDKNVETLLVILNHPHAAKKTLAQIMDCSFNVTHARIRSLLENLGEMTMNGIWRPIHKADIPDIVERFRRDRMR